MSIRKFYLALAAGTLMAGSAYAQGVLVKVGDDVQVAPLTATADDVDDWDVFNSEGVEIGEVEEVVGTDANTPTALVVDFDGTAGHTDRDVVIPLDQFTQQNGRLVLNADAAAVGQMPDWHD